MKLRSIVFMKFKNYHLTNLMLDENSLTGEFTHQLAEGRKNKAHADTCEITGEYQYQMIINWKTFLITMYNICSAHLA